MERDDIDVKMFLILLGIKHVILKFTLNPTDIPIKSIFAKNYKIIKSYNRHNKNWAFGVGVFGVYLEIG